LVCSVSIWPTIAYFGFSLIGISTYRNSVCVKKFFCFLFTSSYSC